jgi:hypothetical protein
VDDEHILALVEAVHGTHSDAVHRFAANAPIVDDVSQFNTPKIAWARNPKEIET